MKKRLFAALVCAMMVMLMLPAAAFAASATSVWIAGAELTSANPYYHNGTSGAPGVANNSATNYNAYFDTNAGTLTLKGLDVRNSTVTKEMLLGAETDTAVYAVFAEGDLTICVDGSNSVSVAPVIKTDANAYSLALYVTGRLTVQPGVTGSGSLTAESEGAIVFNSDSSRETALCSGITSNTLVVSSGAEIIGKVSGESAASVVFNGGINLDAVTVSGGTLKGIASGEVMCGGETDDFAITCGIFVNKGDLSLTAGSVEATGGQSLSAAGTSYGVAMDREDDSISITGGSFTAKIGTETSGFAVQNPLTLGSGITAKGSTSNSGTPYVDYKEADNATYKWVSAKPPVTTVAVNPASVSIQKGGTQTFHADVFGPFSPAQTVIWSVTGGVTGTSIDANGVLTVAANETAATLTVKAISTVDTTKFGVATVTVTAAAPTEYKITRGQNGEWTKDSDAGLGFTADGDYSKFTGVSVDGRTLAENKYTAVSGSTVVTLDAGYLDSLSAGRHTLRVSFTNGYAETNFTVQAAAVPDTGDSAQPVLWLGIALMACAGLAAGVFIRRRKQNG